MASQAVYQLAYVSVGELLLDLGDVFQNLVRPFKCFSSNLLVLLFVLSFLLFRLQGGEWGNSGRRVGGPVVGAFNQAGREVPTCRGRERQANRDLFIACVCSAARILNSMHYTQKDSRAVASLTHCLLKKRKMPSNAEWSSFLGAAGAGLGWKVPVPGICAHARTSTNRSGEQISAAGGRSGGAYSGVEAVRIESWEARGCSWIQLAHEQSSGAAGGWLCACGGGCCRMKVHTPSSWASSPWLSCPYSDPLCSSGPFCCVSLF